MTEKQQRSINELKSVKLKISGESITKDTLENFKQLN